MQYRWLTGKIGWKEKWYRRMGNYRNYFSEICLYFPGGAVVETPYSQCKISGFNHCLCIPSSVASIVSNSVWPYGLQPTRLLCPWDSPGKNTGVGCHALLQRIFPTLGSNPRLMSFYLHWQVGSLPLAPPGKPQSLVRELETTCRNWVQHSQINK